MSKPVDLTYEQACHAMQSGVAFEMERDPKPTEPKHLRVGVNSALVNDEALVQLLIAKGIITQDEYLEALRVAMNEEVDRYQSRIERRYGLSVELR